MIANILLPTDFSEVANNALSFALDLCKKTHAKLHVLHVKQVPVLDTSFPTDTYQLYIDEIEKASKEGLDKLQHQVLAPSGVSFVLDSTVGFVNDEVLTYAHKHQIDLIVMGTTGASGLQEIFIGSNAASVVAKSDLPIMVIPPSAKHIGFGHILYASDYAEPEFPAMSRLAYIAELYSSKITVMHAKSDNDRYFNTTNNFFTRNKEHISTTDITIVNTEQSDIMDAINKYIDVHQTDLVVLAKHNRSFFDRLFHRSLSKKMTYHTKVPLLVLHK